MIQCTYFVSRDYTITKKKSVIILISLHFTFTFILFILFIMNKKKKNYCETICLASLSLNILNNFFLHLVFSISNQTQHILHL